MGLYYSSRLFIGVEIDINDFAEEINGKLQFKDFVHFPEYEMEWVVQETPKPWLMSSYHAWVESKTSHDKLIFRNVHHTDATETFLFGLELTSLDYSSKSCAFELIRILSAFELVRRVLTEYDMDTSHVKIWHTMEVN